tara:strand:- start:656 stop:805 length:150 start_codon:yes stop_codon:yes gene_type:complete
VVLVLALLINGLLVVEVESILQEQAHQEDRVELVVVAMHQLETQLPLEG